MSSERNQSSVTSPSEAMSSYLGDLLGEANTPTSLDDAGVMSVKEPIPRFLSAKIIEPGHWLIPTTAMGGYAADFDRPQYSLTKTCLLLFWGLYLLRRPISGKLRSCVLEHCHELMMQRRLLLGMVDSATVKRGAI